MAILDHGQFQGWCVSFDRYERVKRQFDAASQMGTPELCDYLRGELDRASADLNTATKALKKP